MEEFVLYFETEELKSGRGFVRINTIILELRRDVVLLLLLFFVMLPGLLAGIALCHWRHLNLALVSRSPIHAWRHSIVVVVYATV